MKQKRGGWIVFEDRILIDYINAYGEGHWSKIPINTGLKRSAKREIKRGNITEQEEDLIIRMHKLLGNRWSLIAGRLPGRTDNEIKNYCNTVLSKKVEGCPSIIPTKNKKTKEAASNINEEAISHFNDAMINISEQQLKCDCSHQYNVDGTPSAIANLPEGSEFHGDALASFSSTSGAENDDEFALDFAARDVKSCLFLILLN